MNGFEILQNAKKNLVKAGNLNPALDSRLLLQFATKANSETLLYESKSHNFTSEQIEKFNFFLERRIKGEPTSRIIGKRSFWDVDFILKENVFDPRPETELLVEEAVKIEIETPHILDLGTGTGCILISILKNRPKWLGVGVDKSPHAIKNARLNAQNLDLSERAHFICADWCANFSGNFDIVLSNPPYIPSSDIETLSVEVRSFDPFLALSGGKDGLECYRELALMVPNLLKPNGKLLLELGYAQASAVKKIFEKADFRIQQEFLDLNGIVRVLLLDKA